MFIKPSFYLLAILILIIIECFTLERNVLCKYYRYIVYETNP